MKTLRLSWPSYEQAAGKYSDTSPAHWTFPCSEFWASASPLAYGVLEGGKPNWMCGLSKLWPCWQALPVT